MPDATLIPATTNGEDAGQVDNDVWLAFVVALRCSRPHASRPFQIPWSIRGVPLFAVVGLIGNRMLALFMDGQVFRSGMVLLVIGLVASIFAVKYEREAA